jgi:hypothetical protein
MCELTVNSVLTTFLESWSGGELASCRYGQLDIAILYGDLEQIANYVEAPRSSSKRPWSKGWNPLIGCSGSGSGDVLQPLFAFWMIQHQAINDLFLKVKIVPYKCNFDWLIRRTPWPYMLSLSPQLGMESFTCMWYLIWLGWTELFTFNTWLLRLDRDETSFKIILK